MSTYNLSIYITGKNSRAIHITGDMRDDITSIQILRSFSPVNSQREDDTKLYGSQPDPLFQVYIDDPYDQSNRLGEDTDDWEILGYLDNGSCVFIDDTKMPWNKSRDLYYKARIYTEEGFIDTDPTPAGRGSIWHTNSDVKALIKSINTEIELNGRNGFLLKARKWGKKCHKCVDFGTGRPVDDHCPVCMGTGYEGGYYEAIRLPIIDQAPQVASARTQIDYVESEILQARCVAYPVINRGDIWVGCNYNDRYIIDQCSPTSLYKGVPVVYTLSMKKLPQTAVAYSKDVKDIIEDSYVNWETIGK
jgi:hypothetical protein